MVAGSTMAGVMGMHGVVRRQGKWAEVGECEARETVGSTRLLGRGVGIWVRVAASLVGFVKMR